MNLSRENAFNDAEKRGPWRTSPARGCPQSGAVSMRRR